MYICICEGVTERQIKKAIVEGASSVRDLRKELGVASQCGQCGRCAKNLLEEHRGESACQRLSKQVPNSGLVNIVIPPQEATV